MYWYLCTNFIQFSIAHIVCVPKYEHTHTHTRALVVYIHSNFFFFCLYPESICLYRKVVTGNHTIMYRCRVYMILVFICVCIYMCATDGFWWWTIRHFLHKNSMRLQSLDNHRTDCMTHDDVSQFSIYKCTSVVSILSLKKFLFSHF